MKGKEAGQAYLQGVLGKITDPELRTAAERVFADATIQVEIGNGVAGQSEIDRQLQELRTKTDDLTAKEQLLAQQEEALGTWRNDLNNWAEGKKELVALGAEAKKAGFDPKNPTRGGATVVPENVVTKEALTEALKSELGGVMSFALEQSSLNVEHFAKFGKPLDVTPLLTHPKIREVGLKGVYELVHADALKAHDDAKRQADEDRIRADERQKIAAKNVDMPYLSPTGVGSGSPLDAIKPAAGDSLVGTAVAEYQRLQTTRVQ